MTDASGSDLGRASLKIVIAGFCILTLLALALSGLAQERRALTLDGIILLIRAGTSSARITQLIEKHGVAFELDEEALRQLREAGASAVVVSAAKKMATQYAGAQQRQKREAEAAAKAEQERQEREAKARVERERREKEAAAKAERERQQKEAAAKAEQERQEREAKARVERERREKEAAAKANSQITSVRPAETPTLLPRTELKQLSIIVLKRDLGIRERLDLTVRGRYSDGSEVNLKSGLQWKSSDPTVAFVNTKGEIQALKEGSTQISATYQGVSSDSYTFNVKANEESRKPQGSGGEIKDQRRRLLR
jgi:hypothetical protein